METSKLKRIFSVYCAFLALGAALYLAGCKSVQEAPSPPPTGAQITAMGQAHMKEATPARLLQWASTWHGTHPNAVLPVLNEFFDLEQVLAGERFKAGKLDDAYFHLGNVRQGRGLPTETWKAFILDYLGKLEATGRSATAKYLHQEIEGSPSQDLYEPMDVADYFKYLVEVRLLTHYVDPDSGLSRTTHPGSQGTGFLIGPRHLLTAFHVVRTGFHSNAVRHEVRLRQGERSLGNGKILAWDNISDLAVIELETSTEAPAQAWKHFGNSRRLRRGFEVFGLGNPFGLRSTLTRGIISSLDRKGFEGEAWIQFDATQAPGSSGGILVGKDGLVYGVLVAGFDGAALNFAVPSHTVLRYLDRMLQGQSVGHGWLGLQLETSTGGDLNISGFFPASPFAGLKIEPGARLLRINQTPVRTMEQVRLQMDLVQPGQVVSLVVQNLPALSTVNSNQAATGTNAFTCWGLAGRRPSNPVFWSQYFDSGISTLSMHFGLTLDPAPTGMEQIALDNQKMTFPIFRVHSVQPETYLWRMGLRMGDSVVVLKDTFEGKNRLFTLLHIPSGKTLHWALSRPGDSLIYRMKRESQDDDAI